MGPGVETSQGPYDPSFCLTHQNMLHVPEGKQGAVRVSNTDHVTLWRGHMCLLSPVLRRQKGAFV